MKIHFFTLVINGMPFIRYHLDVFNKLTVPWHWHIVEGLADLTHDTGWGLHSGARITPDMHVKGLSVDGTTDYVNSIRSDRVTVYRTPQRRWWDGKVEMVNAPLVTINEPGLLWEVDVDELWTYAQIHDVYDLFEMNPSKTAAYYRCKYFVGPDLWISNLNCYANQKTDWLRTWRFEPGDFWEKHEPPVLVRDGKDIGKVNPFTDEETSLHNIVFQHMAYTTEGQVRFKENYYGYADAVEHWKKLQAHTQFPAMLSDFFPWVKDNAVVDKINFQPLFPCL